MDVTRKKYSPTRTILVVDAHPARLDAISGLLEARGLELVLVRSLVEGHGGKIVVESEIDQGSTFTVRLPL